MNQYFPTSTTYHTKPEIAVLIPYFNDDEALTKTLLSLEYKGFMQLVVVDDGSRKKLAKKDLMTFISDQSKLTVIALEKNLGIEKALNVGLDYIKTNLNCKYIARIDSGDIQISDRLNKQVEYLEENKSIGILGTAAEFTEPYGYHSFTVRYPLNNKEIKKQMGLRCCILHPTVMFRSSVLQPSISYPNKYPYADDYALFYSLLKNTQAANLEEVLTKVVQSQGSISLQNRKKQLWSRIRIIYDNFFSSPYSVIGLLYTSIMMLLPYSMIVQLKRRFQ